MIWLIYGKPRAKISKWFDKNFSKKGDYKTAKKAHLHFLNIKEGDIIAVKSKGMMGNLTIIAYAEVVSKNSEIYFYDTTGELGHCIHVNFLETDLNIETNLNYAQTIHHIVPYSKKGHFEKIFKGFSVLEQKKILIYQILNYLKVESMKSKLNQEQELYHIQLQSEIFITKFNQLLQFIFKKNIVTSQYP